MHPPLERVTTVMDSAPISIASSVLMVQGLIFSRTELQLETVAHFSWRLAPGSVTSHFFSGHRDMRAFYSPTGFHGVKFALNAAGILADGLRRHPLAAPLFMPS